MNDYVNTGYVENGVAYFGHDSDILFEITGIGGGGGGSGGGNDQNHAVLTVTNTTGWLSKTIADNAACPISVVWSSIEDDMPTGDGTLRITVNGAIRATLQISQGNVQTNLTPYLGDGANIIRVQIADIYGNARTINFSVTVVALSLSSTFDTTTTYMSAISFPYTPVGAVAKTVYFYLDNQLIGTQETSVSNRQMTYAIPAQSHGSHSLRVYFTASINGETVSSNELYFEFISISPLNDNIIISSSFNQGTVWEQYSLIPIPFQIYDPLSLTTEVTISVNGNIVSEQTVDRSEQSYTYRANNYGLTTVVLTSGNTTKQISFTVTESSIDIQPETESLVLYLTSVGRSNNEEHPELWSYGEGSSKISATLNNFSFTNDGWQQDSDGAVCLRVAGAARVSIPYKPFANDFRTTGKTI